MAFFDVRIFDPNTKRYSIQSLQRRYINNEKEKKRQYNMSVLQIENGSSTTLVFSINEALDREASKSNEEKQGILEVACYSKTRCVIQE